MKPEGGCWGPEGRKGGALQGGAGVLVDGRPPQGRCVGAEARDPLGAGELDPQEGEQAKEAGVGLGGERLGGTSRRWVRNEPGRPGPSTV